MDFKYCYSFDLNLPSNIKSEKKLIFPWNWRSLCENHIYDPDYETNSFRADSLSISENLSTNSSITAANKTRASVEEIADSLDNTLEHIIKTNDDDNDNDEISDEIGRKPNPCHSWRGRQHISFVDEYEGEPTCSMKIYLPSVSVKLDKYQFKCVMNVINFALLASHQTHEELHEKDDDQTVIFSQSNYKEKQKIIKELKRICDNSNKKSQDNYIYFPFKIVEYQINSISWKMTDIRNQMFMKTELTNIFGYDLLKQNLSRNIAISLQHFQVTEPKDNNKKFFTDIDNNIQPKELKNNSIEFIDDTNIRNTTKNKKKK